jgi:hypothetical protein
MKSKTSSHPVPVVKKTHFEEAKQFIDALSPRSESGPLFDTYGEWVFRGHADARWRLVPSALRPDSWPNFEYFGSWGAMNGTNLQQLQLELRVVRRFAVYADRQTLPVPSLNPRWLDDETFRGLEEEILMRVFEGGNSCPPGEVEPLFGLAQHYGVPTRLLDWSESAYVAAYFAAVEARACMERAKKLGKAEPKVKLAVWAYKSGCTKDVKSLKYGSLKVVRAPWSGNPNLYAQKGLFTLHRENFSIVSSGQCSGDSESGAKESFRTTQPKAEPMDLLIDKIISEHLKVDRSEDQWQYYGSVLHLLTLPWQEASSLLHLLMMEGVNGATLFPGYAGVVRGMRERRFLL